MEFGVGVAGGHHPDGLRRHLGQGAVQPGLDGRGPVPGGDEDQGRLPGQAGEDRHRVGEGRHRQFMGPVDEFPDEALDDVRAPGPGTLPGERW